tara:strand:+ start:467 stop:769 length:303 start_codon:yes stop_codon:yes gene_type:complete
MQSFKEFISEQNRNPIKVGAYDAWGNPIYSPEYGGGISNYDELMRELRSKATTKWVQTGVEGAGPYMTRGWMMPKDVIDAIKDDPGNMDDILDDYLNSTL